MEYVSFALRIKPEDREAYRERHRRVDPELENKFSVVGIRRYHIFEHEGTLFAYMEVEDFDRAMSQLATDPANLRWQQYMSDMLIAWEDGSTVKPIEEMYRFQSSS